MYLSVSVRIYCDIVHCFLCFTVTKDHDNSTSIDISRANSLTDELDYMSEDIPLPVMTEKAQ